MESKEQDVVGHCGPKIIDFCYKDALKKKIAKSYELIVSLYKSEDKD